MRQWILGCQEPLGSRAVPLAFGILLEGIGDSDGPVAEILSIHGLDGSIRSIKAGEVNEGVAL